MAGGAPDSASGRDHEVPARLHDPQWQPGARHPSGATHFFVRERFSGEYSYMGGYEGVHDSQLFPINGLQLALRAVSLDPPRAVLAVAARLVEESTAKPSPAQPRHPERGAA